MEDDLFNTEEYSKIPEYSSIPPPISAPRGSLAPQRPRPTRNTKHYPHTQDIRTLQGHIAEDQVLIGELLDSPVFILPMGSETAKSCLDYFSEGFIREELDAVLKQMETFDRENVKNAVKKVDPYSELRQTALFDNRKAIIVCPMQMANLHALFPHLISEKNFLIPCYNFVTICDKGGFAECIQKRYSDINVSLNEVNGWALFPRGEITVPGVTPLTKSELNFESLQWALQEVRKTSDSEIGQSIMMLTTSFSVTHSDPVRRERLMKLYLCYSLYSAFSLLCKDGNLVIKLYTTFQPATVELLYLLYRHFNTVSIIKPLAMKAASPARVVVCEGFDGSGKDKEAMEKLCMVMERLHKMEKDLEHVIELAQVTKSESFLSYLRESNHQITTFQIARLKEVLENLSAANATVPNKRDIAERCLVEWGLMKSTSTEETVETRQSAPVRYSAPNPESVSQRSVNVDYSQFSSILSRGEEHGRHFTPMTRFEKESEDRNDFLASLTNDRRDAKQRSVRLLEPKVKKPQKRQRQEGDAQNTKKKQKHH